MGWLRQLLGGKRQNETYVDEHGLYFYVACDKCGTVTRLRADKRHDLNRTDGGHTWHKNIVDTRCFRPMTAVVVFNGRYEIIEQKIDGGRFVSAAEYELAQRDAAAKSAADAEEEE